MFCRTIAPCICRPAVCSNTAFWVTSSHNDIGGNGIVVAITSGGGGVGAVFYRANCKQTMLRYKLTPARATGWRGSELPRARPPINV